MTDEEMWRLLVGHSRDQLTVADAARLRAWVDADATRQEMVRGVEAIVAASRERPADTDADASWAAVRARIAQRDAGAASVERRVAHPWRRAGAIAAAVLVAAGAIVGGRVLWLAQRAAAPLQEYRTARGERVAVVLTDGTRITLGAASRLYAPERFGRTRTVFLEGQAFFEVAHDTAHPFIVRAGDAAARAVGTAFAVRRYPDDSVVRVVVTEGRVQLGAQGAPAGSGALLGRGDVGELRPGGAVAVAVHGAHLDDDLGWLQSRLVYHGVAMRDVMADVTRWYDVELRVTDATMADARITLTIPGNATVDDVARLLADVLGARYERVGRVITFQPADR